MVLPFEIYGHNVTYYKLNNDYTIDIHYLKGLMSKIDTDFLFLYMNYFGITAISDDDLYNLKSCYPNANFIEDITHTLIWKTSSKFIADFTVASLRKWINIPDGGLLWHKKPLKNNCFSDDTSFSATRLKAQCMRNRYFETGDESLKETYRKIFSSVSSIMDSDKNPSRMTVYSYEIAKNTNWDLIRNKRKENSKKLIQILNNTSIKIIQNDINSSSLYVPFLIEIRDIKQIELSKEGIFNTIIWPLNNKQKEICEVSMYTQQHMLAAPCDQRYDVSDMEYIGNEIVRIVNE
jgi:hypothetical protein